MGKYYDARKTFEEMLLDYPGTPLSDPIFWGLVKTYLGTNDVERAILLHQRFLAQFAASPWAELSLYDVGQYYFDKKEYFRAADLFRQILRTYPESDIREWVYFMLGESLFNAKDYPNAIAAYQQTRGNKKIGLVPQALLRLGYAYFNAKDYARAIQSWERVLKEFPTSLGDKNEILYWLAEASLLKRDYRKGVETIEQLKGDPKFYPRGLNSLGWYHFQEGEWVKANEYFLRLLEGFPQYQTTPPVALMVGQCYLNLGDYAKAKTYLGRLASAAGQEGDDGSELSPRMAGV
jgi:TolA-binding protein